MKNKFLIFTLLLSTQSFALVNLQLGSWEWSATLANTTLSYNSRSLYQGWWGMGWCSELEIKVEIEKGVAKAKDCRNNDLKVEISIGGFKSQLQDKTYHFDTRGRLVKIENKLQEYKTVHILWDNKLPRQIYTQNRSWIPEFNRNKDLITKLYSKYDSYDFTYVDNQLKMAKSQDDWHFQYDTQGNMTFLQAQDQTLNLKYDMAMDRVVEVKAKEGCKTKYNYFENQAAKEFHLVTTVQRRCSESSLQTKQVQSQFEILAGRSAKLKTVKEAYL